MQAVILQPVPVNWVCPNCVAALTTPGIPPKPILHPCPGLRGLAAPMVREGVKCKVEAHEREDYVLDEQVQTDGEGRPVMSVETTREDGNDLVVFAPIATARVEDYR